MHLYLTSYCMVFIIIYYSSQMPEGYIAFILSNFMVNRIGAEWTTDPFYPFSCSFLSSKTKAWYSIFTRPIKEHALHKLNGRCIRITRKYIYIRKLYIILKIKNKFKLFYSDETLKKFKCYLWTATISFCFLVQYIVISSRKQIEGCLLEWKPARKEI